MDLFRWVNGMRVITDHWNERLGEVETLFLFDDKLTVGEAELLDMLVF
jgi:hypothetical protein